MTDPSLVPSVEPLMPADTLTSAGLTLPPMDRTISSTSSAVSNGPSTSSRVTLRLIHQFSYRAARDSMPVSELISAKRTHTVAKVKLALNKHLPGRPNVDGIRLIQSGKVLLDHQTVAELVAENQSETHIHIVVRPDAWVDIDNAPLTPTGPPAVLSSHRNAPLISHPASAGVRRRPSLDPLNGNSYFLLPSEMPTPPHRSSPTLIASSSTLRPQDVMQMDSLPKVLSMSYVLYYQRYDILYRAFERQQSSSLFPASAGGLNAIDKLYCSLGLANTEARKALSAVEKQIFGWSEWIDRNAPDNRYDLDPLLRECCQRLDELRLMLQQMEQAHSDKDTRSETSAVDPTQATLAMNDPRPPASQQNTPTAPPARPEIPASNATAARIPHIPLPSPWELFAMMLPVAFLALKLAVLLYIFTRGASPTKKWTMYGVTYLWITFEMIRAWRRRIRRLQGAQRRAARSAAAQRGGHARRGSRPHSSAPRGGEQSSPANSSGTGVPVAPRRFTVASPSQSKFWLQRIAFLGMEEEDLELGFRPSSSQAHIWLIRITRERSTAQRRAEGGRALLPRNLLAKVDVAKVINNLSFPIVLYLATLIPEVEELRMEEIRRRDRLIRKWWSERGSKWVENRRKQKRERENEQQHQDSDKGQSSGSDARQQNSRRSSELPRLLKHPYVLSLLLLKPSSDGFVEPRDPTASTSAGGDRIDIQEELDAVRAMQRRPADPVNEADVDGGDNGDAVGAHEADSDGVEDDHAAEGAEDDFGFF